MVYLINHFAGPDAGGGGGGGGGGGRVMGVATPPFQGKHITEAMYGCGNAGLA